MAICLAVDGHPVVRTLYVDSVPCAALDPREPTRRTCTGRTPHRVVAAPPRPHKLQRQLAWRCQTTLAGEFKRTAIRPRASRNCTVATRHRLGFDEVELHEGYVRSSRDRARDPRSYDDYLAWLASLSGESLTATTPITGVHCSSTVARSRDKAERGNPATWAVIRAIDFLHRRDTAIPFFCTCRSWRRPTSPRRTHRVRQPVRTVDHQCKEKYIRFSNDGTEQLFDLTTYPHETHDPSSEPAYVHGRQLVTGRDPVGTLAVCRLPCARVMRPITWALMNSALCCGCRALELLDACTRAAGISRYARADGSLGPVVRINEKRANATTWTATRILVHQGKTAWLSM